MAISDYCRCDVLDTYFVFLRTQVMMGIATSTQEIQLVEAAKDWIEQRADACEAYRAYLDRWIDWQNPWQSEELVS